MKIGIIGAGNVGGNLGKIWAGNGHKILFGTRDTKSEKIQSLLNACSGNVRADSLPVAAAFGEVIVLAVHWPVAEQVIKSLGDLNGKILVDCTNPLLPGMSGLAVNANTSAAESIALWAPGAKVVKAFNTIGAKNLLNPKFGLQSASMFICGDEKNSKSVVSTLVKDVGFEPIDTGPLSNARLLESLALLWIQLAFVQGLGPNIAIKLLRR